MAQLCFYEHEAISGLWGCDNAHSAYAGAYTTSQMNANTTTKPEWPAAVLAPALRPKKKKKKKTKGNLNDADPSITSVAFEAGISAFSVSREESKKRQTSNQKYDQGKDEHREAFLADQTKENTEPTRKNVIYSPIGTGSSPQPVRATWSFANTEERARRRNCCAALWQTRSMEIRSSSDCQMSVN